jgi:uncharacterized protein (TIGR03084 family)
VEEGGESPPLLYLSDTLCGVSNQADVVLRDLNGEVAALSQLLSGLSDNQWSSVTPAEGWNVADQVIHLGLFDQRCLWSIVDEERFRTDLHGMATVGGVEGLQNSQRGKSPAELFSWWRDGAQELAHTSLAVDLSKRCAWYGPSMSARSMLTARLMETWAHGLDIADAVGESIAPTDRLIHVAHIGVRAMGFAFIANGRKAPEEEVFVELLAPSGETWTWGSPDAASSVRGSAFGFCCAVTQRRHVNDCGLTAIGDVAQEWMSIAQAFAGPPGSGRAEGQFS